LRLYRRATPDGNPRQLTSEAPGTPYGLAHTHKDRAPELQQAAPEAWVELAPTDAEQLGISDGDLVAVESARGKIEAPARLTGIREGVVFVPFHYGYWDEPEGSEPNGRAHAANELTITRWDPVSKQPISKTAAVRVAKLADGDGPARVPAIASQEPI
jgi:ferredoxin-nitrate reductase